MSGIVDFFKKVGHEIKTAALAFGHVFVAFFGKDATHQLIQAAEKILASDFGKVIMSIVEGLMEYKAANGDTPARDKAASEIKNAAIAAGVDIKDSLINLLVELAANKANGTLDSLQSVISKL
jgi:hypothetical protein